MEAFALGLPSIVSRTSQVSYFYKSDAFVMVEPVESDISRGIEEFFKREIEWLNMSNSAKQLVEKTFNWDAVALEMKKMYQKALS
jgi:glycosyltransferase involved in cell wall biosynthesis